MQKQKSLILLILFGFLSQTVYSQTPDQVADYKTYKKCDQYVYNRPQIFQVTGTGSNSLAPTVGIVVLGITVKSKNAADAFKQSSDNISAAMGAIKLAAGNNNSITTFTTSQLTIQPDTQTVYDPKTLQYNTVKLGYVVSNILTIRTKDLNFVGTIIDKGINSGLNDVRSVTFDLEPQEKKLLQESLIKDAVLDAIARAKLALTSVGERIKGIKSINIFDQTPQAYPIAMNSMAFARVAAPTQVFAGEKKINTQVSVGFIVEQDPSAKNQ